ncbi:MAG: BatA domain-containing protein [Thermoguttaceae bacterium]
MFSFPSIFAFGIAHLPMLWWLAGAAAPLVIHLLSRRRYRETPWAAMEYLLAALRRRARRIQIQQWLLLALRTLLVVLVVLAVAEPYTRRPGLAFVPGIPTHRVLVLDASYSMATKSGDTTLADSTSADASRFDQAKELAVRIVDDSPQGDAFTLVLLAAPPRMVVARPTVDAATLREEIENLEVLHTGADLPATVRTVAQLVEQARREDSRLQRHVVYFLTDLQRTTWAPELGEAAMAEFRRQTAELAQEAALEVIDLGQPPEENLAVTRLAASESVVTVGRSVELEAELWNFGHNERVGQPVELWIDGRRAARQSVTVSAGREREATVHFSYRFDTPGDHWVEVRAEGDALDVDNHRWLVVPVRQAVRVLCIDGRPSGDPAHGTTGYLAAALAPGAGRADHSPVEVDVAAEGAILERDLAAYDCVFLSNVPRFTPSEVQAMDAYLARGGNLVFFLGDQVMLDEYNRQLGSEGGGRRILGARLDSVVQKPQLGLDALGYRHPIVEAFRGQSKSGLLNTIVLKYIKLQVRKDSAAKVVLAMADGDPLVIEEPVRRGRVVLVATSADVSWTPMPVWFSYVPLVQEILAWCVGQQMGHRNVEVGEPLEAPVTAAAGDVPVTVERPDGQARSAPLHTAGGDGAWTYGDTYRSGIYTARFGPPLAGSRSFAVNVNTSESDLTPIGVEELQDEVWPGIPFACQPSSQALAARVAGPGPRTGRLARDLLYAVLGLLFVETFLAWRLGYHG